MKYKSTATVIKLLGFLKCLLIAFHNSFSVGQNSSGDLLLIIFQLLIAYHLLVNYSFGHNIFRNLFFNAFVNLPWSGELRIKHYDHSVLYSNKAVWRHTLPCIRFSAQNIMAVNACLHCVADRSVTLHDCLNIL